jgi:serine/threonine-protein kinase
MAIPSTIAERIDSLRDAFETSLRAGENPKIETMLGAVGVTWRPELLRQLLVVELDYRGRAGEVSTVDAYRDRFPRFEEVIERVFGSGDQSHGLPDQTAGTPLAGAVEQTTIDAGHTPETRSDAGVLPREGDRIRYFGDYELERNLGQGGMGVVYAARQMSLNRPVALKLIRDGEFASADDRRRFQNEAEAVALLDHPNIVPIYEVGEHEGRRYFSMKLVSGGSLEKRLAAYRDDFHAAARLVADTADAVHHAHMRGILHRDLKPANILIDDEGTPHVTDFGLAKRVAGGGDPTESGRILGTPGYMAPEQATGRRDSITTATDVYGLGSILYALLTGRAPFVGDSVVDTLQKVREQPPEPPVHFNARVPRDLEVICLKCLEKDPRRRYGSAHALAADLRHWLANEPIAARPVRALERGWLWCKRRPAIAGLSAALLAALPITAVLAVDWGRQQSELAKRQTLLAQQQTMAAETERGLRAEADKRRTEAEREAAKAVAVREFLVDDILAQAMPENHARSQRVTIEDALDLGSPMVAERFAGQPDVEIAVRDMIGSTYRMLGLLEKAEPHLRRAVELGLSAFGELNSDTLEAMNSLATLFQDQDKLAEAEPLFERSFDGFKKVLGPRHEKTFRATNNLALLRLMRGKPAEAEAMLRELVAVRSEAQGAEDRGILTNKANLAIALRDLGRWDEAERLFYETNEARQRTLGKRHPDTTQGLGSLANFLIARDKLEEAERFSHELHETRSDVEGPEHPRTLNSMNLLAQVLRRRGKLEAAESLIRQCLATRERVQAREHDDTLAALNILASILQDTGRYAESERYFRQILESVRKTRGETHPRMLTAKSNLALVLLLQGRNDEAEAIYRGILALGLPDFPRAHPITLNRIHLLALVLLDKGDPGAAEPFAREALEGRTKTLGMTHRDTHNSLETLGEALLNLGHAAEAEPLLRQAISLRSQAGRESPYGEHLLGACLVAAGRHAEAEPHLVGGFQRFLASPSFTRARRRRGADRVISLYELWGKPDRALEWQLKRQDLLFPDNVIAK